MTSSAQTPEPTDEQRAVARIALPGKAANTVSPAVRSAMDAVWADTVEDVARALAAAVTAERERVIALCLQVMTENESPDDWGVSAVYPSIVARRIREVSR